MLKFLFILAVNENKNNYFRLFYYNLFILYDLKEEFLFTCINKINNLYFNLKYNSVLLANYFLIFYAFFLPISKDISNIAFIIVIILFFVDGNIKNKLKFALKDKVVFSILIGFDVLPFSILKDLKCL